MDSEPFITACYCIITRSYGLAHDQESWERAKDNIYENVQYVYVIYGLVFLFSI